MKENKRQERREGDGDVQSKGKGDPKRYRNGERRGDEREQRGLVREREPGMERLKKE